MEISAFAYTLTLGGQEAPRMSNELAKKSNRSAAALNDSMSWLIPYRVSIAGWTRLRLFQFRIC